MPSSKACISCLTIRRIPIARKALRVNLSDLAAKGATPAGFVLTLALRAADEAWLTPFARGLGEDASSSAARCWAATRFRRRGR